MEEPPSQTVDFSKMMRMIDSHPDENITQATDRFSISIDNLWNTVTERTKELGKNNEWTNRIFNEIMNSVTFLSTADHVKIAWQLVTQNSSNTLNIVSDSNTEGSPQVFTNSDAFMISLVKQIAKEYNKEVNIIDCQNKNNYEIIQELDAIRDETSPLIIIDDAAYSGGQKNHLLKTLNNYIPSKKNIHLYFAGISQAAIDLLQHDNTTVHYLKLLRTFEEQLSEDALNILTHYAFNNKEKREIEKSPNAITAYKTPDDTSIKGNFYKNILLFLARSKILAQNGSEYPKIPQEQIREYISQFEEEENKK